MIPIIGWLKGLAESIIGRDLTGRKLETWERGLALLLAFLPHARGILKAGKGGYKMLAPAGAEAVRRGQKAEDVFRLAKVASRMSEREIQAVRLAGKMPNATQLRALENMVDRFDEMQGLSKRSWRAAAGTIDTGQTTSRSASGVVDTAAGKPGKLITASKATVPIFLRLTEAGVSPQAIAELERTGVVFSQNVVNTLAKSKNAIHFVNRFHTSPGFTVLVKDLGVSAGKRDGALFAMAYAVKKIDPRLAKFELGAGITERVRSTEVVARHVDISAGGIEYELKSWSKQTLEKALRNPSQLVKDTAIFGRAGIKWVFNSAKISKNEVVELFKWAVQSDPYLAAKWPKGNALDAALDDLIEMFPPVP
ncbi:MAG: pre-toxin TG domain-containing protein [Phycisphaerales bacterium]|nr:pre-toxin TG domain-containing protein [Phycisphaerales bacterium]